MNRCFHPTLATVCAALAIAATASARSITGVSFTQSSGGEKRVNVAIEAGVSGDDHALYLAFDTADKGEDMASWATFQRVGRVASGDTAASAVVSSLAAGAYTHCRAFLVENRLPYDTLVESLRQTGTQWFDTGMKPNYRTWCRVAVQFDSNETRQQRAFGITSDGNDAAGFSFSLYINGSGYWSSACQDGRGNWAWGGWSIATTQRAMLTLDANNGSSQGYYFSITNLTTHGNTRYTHQTTRTAESAGTLVVLANRAFAADGTDSITGIMTGGYIDYCQIRDGGENGTPIRDFRPCSVNGRGAMYDAVNGTITYSGGADPFKTDGEALAAAPASGETKLSVSAAVALASPASVGRAITAADYRQAGGVTNIVLTLAPGAAGDNHALYIAWDAIDKGADMANWSHFQRVGRVAADATSASVPISTNLAAGGRVVCRAFLVENALPYDYATPLLRQNRRQWINTGVYASPGTRTQMTLMMDSTRNEQRPFGVDSGNAAVGFSYALYVGSNDHYWYTCCQDGAGNYLRDGWSLPTAQFQTIGLDANDGLAAGYVISVTNLTTGGNARRFYSGTTRTATSTWPIALFARATRNYIAGTNTMAVDSFLEGAYIAACSIWDCEGLVRDYVPVSANGEGGFYDRVTGEVYFSAANSGVPTMYYGTSGATVPTDVAPLVADGGPADCTPVASETMVAVSAAVDITVPHGTVITFR